MQTELFNIIDIKFIKYTIKQNIGIIATCFILSFIVYPLLFLTLSMSIESNLPDIDNLQSVYAINLGALQRLGVNLNYDFNGELLNIPFEPMFLSIVFLTKIIISSIILVVLMNFIHNKKSMDMYFSIPMKKHKIFINRLLVGIIIILLPYVINTILFFMVQNYYGIILMDTSMVLLNILGGLFFILVIYSINCLACVMAKRTIEALIYMLLLNLGSFAVIFAISVMLSFFLPGYALSSVDFILKTSPVTSSILILNLEYNVLLFVFWGCIGLASLITSIHIIKNSHKNELISQIYTLNIGSYLIKAVVIIVSGLAGSVILSNFMTISLLSIIIGFFAVSIVSYIIIYLLLAKGFNGIIKDLKLYVILSVLCVVSMITALNGGLGYSQRLPDPEKIESVHLINFRLPIHLWDTPWVYILDNQELINRYFSEEVINIIRNAHVAIVSSDDFHNYNSAHNNFENINFNVEYTLNNGKKFNRHFTSQPLEARQIIFDMFYNEEFIKKTNILFYIQPHEIINITLMQNNYVTSNRLAHLDIDENIKEDILNALKQDTLNQTRADIIAPTYGPVSTLQMMISPDPSSIAFYSQSEAPILNRNELVNINITPNFINTIEILEELGYHEFTEFYTEDINVIYIINKDIDDMLLAPNRSEVYWSWGLPNLNSLISFSSNQKNIDLGHDPNYKIYTVEELVESQYLIEVRDREQINTIVRHSFDQYLISSEEVKQVFFLHEGVGSINIPSYFIPKSIYNDIFNSINV